MMKQKYFTVFILLIALTVSSLGFSFISKADSQDDASFTVVKTCSCTVNGTERVLTLYSDGRLVFKVKENGYSTVLPAALNVGFDKLGTVYSINLKNNIRWWNYDLFFDAPGSAAIFKPDSNKTEPIENVKELLFDENNEFVIGFKTFSGETYSTLTMNEMKSYLPSDDNSNSTSTPTTPSPSPSAPVTSPDISTPSTIPTSNPSITSPNANSVTPAPAVTKKSVKKKAGYSCLSVGSKVTSKYKLTNGKLTWKGNGKSKKFSGVKSAGFIKKSGNLVFMTKQGKVYTLSSKGKKKCIIKKKAKKLIVKNKFVVKVKVGKKFINLANK